MRGRGYIRKDNNQAYRHVIQQDSETGQGTFLRADRRIREQVERGRVP